MVIASITFLGGTAMDYLLNLKQFLVKAKKSPFHPWRSVKKVSRYMVLDSKNSMNKITNDVSDLKARNYAAEAIELQRKSFRSWGILGDWDSHCYFTYDAGYVKNQLQQFYSLFEKVRIICSPIENFLKILN